jgi:predicted RND superfamily exporter protein
MSVIFGFMGWFNIPLDLMTITIAAISLGIGVDDTIHYIYRFKKELLIDHDYVKAMHRAHSSIGYAMYYTSFAIMLGFSILILSNFKPTIYFGFLTMIAMLMALLGALLLLPKLIIIFGERSKGKFL